MSIFFFQAEDGIRDHCVTGVQTCALPIYRVVRIPREIESEIRGWRAAGGGNASQRGAGGGLAAVKTSGAETTGSVEPEVGWETAARASAPQRGTPSGLSAWPDRWRLRHPGCNASS